MSLMMKTNHCPNIDRIRVMCENFALNLQGFMNRGGIFQVHNLLYSLNFDDYTKSI